MRISSWPGRQKRLTREKPDTFTQTAVCQKRLYACKSGADHTFPDAMSFSTRLSTLTFTTSRFSFAFSCSSSFSRFAWSICKPPYSFRHRKYVSFPISASLQACAVVLPFAIATSTAEADSSPAPVDTAGRVPYGLLVPVSLTFTGTFQAGTPQGCSFQLRGKPQRREGRLRRSLSRPSTIQLVGLDGGSATGSFAVNRDAIF
jgi:hypothetical protein